MLAIYHNPFPYLQLLSLTLTPHYVYLLICSILEYTESSLRIANPHFCGRNKTSNP